MTEFETQVAEALARGLFPTGHGPATAAELHAIGALTAQRVAAAIERAAVAPIEEWRTVALAALRGETP